MRIIVAWIIFSVGLFAGSANGSTPRDVQSPIVFKTLLIIKRHSHIEHEPFLPVRADMTEKDIQIVKDAFEEQLAAAIGRAARTAHADRGATK